MSNPDDGAAGGGGVGIPAGGGGTGTSPPNSAAAWLANPPRMELMSPAGVAGTGESNGEAAGGGSAESVAAAPPNGDDDGAGLPPCGDPASGSPQGGELGSPNIGACGVISAGGGVEDQPPGASYGEPVLPAGNGDGCGLKVGGDDGNEDMRAAFADARMSGVSQSLCSP